MQAVGIDEHIVAGVGESLADVNGEWPIVAAVTDENLEPRASGRKQPREQTQCTLPGIQREYKDADENARTLAYTRWVRKIAAGATSIELGLQTVLPQPQPQATVHAIFYE